LNKIKILVEIYYFDRKAEEIWCVLKQQQYFPLDAHPLLQPITTTKHDISTWPVYCVGNHISEQQKSFSTGSISFSEH
jgi:hypothetical protein